MSSRVFALAALALAAAAPASTPQPAPPTPGVPAPISRLPAYLDEAHAPDTLALLPPAPGPASLRGLADRLVFRGTRSLKGTARWDLAKNDVDEGYAAVLRDFSCAVGGRLTTDNAPRLVTILRHMRNDVVAAVNRPKEHYQRQRPFLLDRGDICVERTVGLEMSPDYPSGHATWGWSIGLLLAELDPAHATQILARARAFGESRVICGVHNASAIEAARMNASIVVAALHGDPAFRADMDAARPEVGALASSGGTDASACAAETRLVNKTYW